MTNHNHRRRHFNMDGSRRIATDGACDFHTWLDRNVHGLSAMSLKLWGDHSRGFWLKKAGEESAQYFHSTREPEQVDPNLAVVGTYDPESEFIIVDFEEGSARVTVVPFPYCGCGSNQWFMNEEGGVEHG